jgi:hypothetical protein
LIAIPFDCVSCRNEAAADLVAHLNLCNGDPTLPCLCIDFVEEEVILKGNASAIIGARVVDGGPDPEITHLLYMHMFGNAVQRQHAGRNVISNEQHKLVQSKGEIPRHRESLGERKVAM